MHLNLGIFIVLRAAVFVAGFLTASSFIISANAAEPPAGKVKVFILAGQSNMEGHGRVVAKASQNEGRGSLEWLARDPAHKVPFAALLDDAGAWRTRDDVWISYGLRRGALTVGYGAKPDLMGPELGFGWVMGEHFSEPVLLIKCAWGGKSLAKDFRPPSSGETVGEYYQLILKETEAALSDLKSISPSLANRGHELVGFGWHQGWNDRVNQKYNDEYEKNLANLVRDLRRDLKTPALPFVVAETGMSGIEEMHPRALSLMRAQAAVAEYPEFKGNVGFVSTKSFWRSKADSPVDQAYHWNNNAETYYLIGQAMAESMKSMLPSAGRK